MEASHKTHRPHMKVGKYEEKKKTALTYPYKKNSPLFHRCYSEDDAAARARCVVGVTKPLALQTTRSNHNAQLRPVPGVWWVGAGWRGYDLERSHRLGRRADKDGRPRTRAIIVRFQSERLRDDVFRARTKLKTYNGERQDRAPIFINDDLTPRRAKLAFDARALKRSKKIADCWTAYGKVMVKDRHNKVTEVKSPSDLHNM